MDIVGIVRELLFDSFKDHFKNAIAKQKIKEIIENYIKHKKEDLEGCSLNEEIDFGGLCNYLKGTLIFDIKKYLTAPGAEQDRLRNQILNSAFVASRANNDDSKHNVETIILQIIEIISDFYREHILTKGELYIAGEIQNNIGAARKDIFKKSDENTQAIINSVKEAQQEIAHGFINCSNKQLMEKISYINRYIENKRENVLNHSLFPWFKESLKYKEVFPTLFIQPNLKERNIAISFNDILEHEKENIAILGEAGAGKSTLLRYAFAFSLIKDKKCIYLTANEANEKDGILDKIIELSAISSEDEYLVLIDGIDEKFAYDFEGLNAFFAKLQGAVNIKFWLGCRTDFYDNNYNENIAFLSHSFEIAPWALRQADYFVEQYSIICCNPSIKKYVDRLIGEKEVIWQIKTNPFMLSLLVYLADNDEKSRIEGIYDLFEKFIQKWIETETKRSTTKVDKLTVIKYLRVAAINIYCGKEYILDETAVDNSAIRNLLLVEKKNDLCGTQYSNAFYHRSIAAFLIAENLIDAFINNNRGDIETLFCSKLKDDVTNFVGNKFSALGGDDKKTIKDNLVCLYEKTDDTDIRILEQLVYYITRLGIDVTDFLERIVDDNPSHNRMRLTIAYGCVLSESVKARRYALDYAKSISNDSVDAITNRAWTVIYFGDVNDRDPYTYSDNEKRSWEHARMARIKRFTSSEPRLKDYRFRLFDIPLFYSFLKDREWNDISDEEYNIILKTEFPNSVFNDEEVAFLEEEKKRLLNDYKNHLSEKRNA